MILGTRGSPLAMWQARHVAATLGAGESGRTIEIAVIRTHGDRTTTPIGAESRGVFVKEIEDALLKGEIDAAVHSLKDLPTQSPPGLTIAAVLSRHDPRDALLSVTGVTVEGLPRAATVATGSPRRRSQLLHARSDLEIVPIRGNVDTRVRKLLEGRFAALVLALAGVERLGIRDVEVRPIPVDRCIPAVGQGAIAVQTRTDDPGTRAVVEPLDDRDTRAAITAERGFLRRLGGGCLAPAAAHARVEGDVLRLVSMVADPDGRRLLRETGSGPVSEAADLGERLASRLLDAGAERILLDAREGAS